VVTLFPEMIEQSVRYGVLGRAVERGLVSLDTRNPRDFAKDVHRTVDDRPYGGGPGMVLAVEPLRSALREARQSMPEGSCSILLSAQGRLLDQAYGIELTQRPGLILIAGRYEGVDERLIECEIDEELSIGDYVLSGGEIASVVVMDVVARLLPGVLGHEESAEQDSFMNGLLDCPHYTRPEEIEGMRVPEVLLRGNHADIRRWRMKQSLGRTWLRRPELLEKLTLSEEQERLLDEFIVEQGALKGG